MGQRNMPCTCPMIDLEMDQQAQCHLHPEPCVLFGGATNFAQPNIHTILPAPGNATNFDVRHLPERHDNALFYGITQYSGVQHHHPAANLDLGVATVSSYHNSYMTPPSGTGVFPLPQNHGSHEQLPSSSNYGIVGVPSNDYGRNNYYMDGLRDSFKRKNAEGIPGNFQYHNASAGSSSSVAPLNTRPFEYGVPMVDAASFGLPEYRVNGIPTMMDGASHRTARNRSGAMGMDSAAHNRNHLIQGNYLAHPFQMASTPWLDQQFNSNGGDGGTSTWNQAPALTYLHGSNVNGSCMEAGNMGVQGYQEPAINRNSINFLHPPIHQGHQSLHHTPPIQGVRGHDINFHPQVAAVPHRLSANSASHSSMNPFQDGMEAGPRYAGPVPPTGLRIYRPQRREVILEATSRQRNLPHLRFLPTDEVAILEISGNYEVRNSIDHHRDMRLDIDHMTYEELLALGEQIGNVGTGLTEETILRHLKSRTYLSSTCTNLEEMACVDQETDFCVICQTDYKNQEKIGILDCGHNYHVDCIKKWLHVKNACPICKSAALTTERKDL